jgi:hypothetical protein
METARKKSAELAISILIGLVGASVTAIPAHVGDRCITAAVLALAFGCALPVALHFRQFGLFGRTITLGWFLIVCVLSILSLWNLVVAIVSSSPSSGM